SRCNSLPAADDFKNKVDNRIQRVGENEEEGEGQCKLGPMAIVGKEAFREDHCKPGRHGAKRSLSARQK
ncbi:MAG TPA: hypothetical protein VD840_12055, partial [Sinorhizobium sp.]|nr:hypothetical protein [Sinorhizobium sp.]